MSIEQFDVVDFISTNKNGEVLLTVSDHLDWLDTAGHQQTLQKKLNAYLAFVESGEILQRYPGAQGRTVVFNVMFKFEPDESGASFLQRAQQVIQSAGFDLRYQWFAESSGDKLTECERLLE